MSAWYSSLFTGLCTRFGPVETRAHDPALALCSGSLPPWNKHEASMEASGIGWTAEEAEAACIGEAIERLHVYPLPDDQVVVGSFDAWSRSEPAVNPGQWVLFHEDQYRQAGFPFRPFTSSTSCSWVCCREVGSGLPWWVPVELAYLNVRSGARHHLAPGISTGLACGRWGHPLVLRGLQEVIERDAVMGAWWGRYPLEEYPIEEVLRGREPTWSKKLLRPNLRYRCLRVLSPFSSFVTLVTLTGEDREGFCFSVGSACRETADLGWEKAIKEAVHGRHYVRHLKRQVVGKELKVHELPTSFPEHAVFYSLFPDRLDRTVLAEPAPRGKTPHVAGHEGLPELQKRLDRPVLVRNMTPPSLAQEGLDWYVLRVLVPGLQPLHGNHQLAHLGGSLWSPRPVEEWLSYPPHPFP